MFSLIGTKIATNEKLGIKNALKKIFKINRINLSPINFLN